MKINKFGLLVSFSVFLYHSKTLLAQEEPKLDSLKNNTESTKDSLLAIIQRYIVTNDNYYRNILYSWTTQEQADQIKTEQKVLIKGRGINEISFFEDSLRSKRFVNHPLAKVLREEQFQNKRFSWTNSWAICNGEKNYGNVLLKMTLKDSALICRVNPFYPDSAQLIDKKGNVIPMNEIDSIKNRIAAVYYINDQYKQIRYTKVYPTFQEISNMSEKLPEQYFYREYIVINEDMIESVDYYSIELLNELKKEIEFLELLLIKLNKSSDKNENSIMWCTKGMWNDSELQKDYLPSLYYYSLAFPNENYKLSSENIQKLINILKEKYKFLKNAK